MRETASPPSLPAHLHHALEQEIDPNESLRWADQPLPSHFVRQNLPLMLLSGGALLALSAGLLWLALDTWHQLRGITPPSPTDPPTLSAIIAFACVALVLAAFAVACLAEPWIALARARRTVFALTNTRILILSLQPSGLARADSLEPAHPLRIKRTDASDGAGEIILCPTPHRSPGQFSLLGVPNPRHVERLIRQTFDPPPPAPRQP